MIKFNNTSPSDRHIQENIDIQSLSTGLVETPALNRRMMMNMMVSAAALATAMPTASVAQLSLSTAANLAGAGTDAELIALASRYIVVQQHYCDLTCAVSDMDCDYGEAPAALKILPGDSAMGKEPLEATDEYWRRPCDIAKWRNMDEWVDVHRSYTDTRIEIITERKPAPEHARARGNQLVSAYDEWQSQKTKPPGYQEALEAEARAEAEYDELRSALVDTRARTLVGLFAKIQCAEAYMKTFGAIDCIEPGDGAEAMAFSIFDDIRSLVSKNDALVNT